MATKSAVCRECGQIYYGPGARDTAEDCADFDRSERTD